MSKIFGLQDERLELPPPNLCPRCFEELIKVMANLLVCPQCDITLVEVPNGKKT